MGYFIMTTALINPFLEYVLKWLFYGSEINFLLNLKP